MGIKKLKPTSPARRYQTYLTRDELTPNAEPEKSLLEAKKRISGRNSDGRITIRRRGGGHKRFYRMIDFKRDKAGIPGTCCADRIRSEPLGAHRPDHLSRRRKALHHRSGRFEGRTRRSSAARKRISCREMLCRSGTFRSVPRFITSSFGREKADSWSARQAGLHRSSRKKAITHSFECLRAKFAAFRSFAMRRSDRSATPSMRMFQLGKAGRSRWMGKRPKVRGVAMNPVDHPHGGGEGKTSGGRNPVTPWGQPTRGYKTRRNKRTQNMIVRDRRRK